MTVKIIDDGQCYVAPYSDLGRGEAFIVDGDIYVKTDTTSPTFKFYYAVALATGELTPMTGDEPVTPITIEVRCVW